MKHIFLLLFNFFLILNIFSQGIRFDQERYSESEQWENEDLGFSGTLPKNYSMRKFCPPVLSQDGLTCVGWASAYGTMSILYNKMFELTSSNEKFLYSFDPNFIYSLIAENKENDCLSGTSLNDAMKTLMNFGCKKMLLPEKTNCDTKINETSKAYAKPYIIKIACVPPDSWFSDNEAGKIKTIKEAIADNIPLVIGLKTTSSLKEVNESGLWDPSSNDNLNGGHAMCIVGYDDTKFGGAFELMNSWGGSYGDNGFNWIKYDDILRHAAEIYLIIPYPLKKSINSAYTCYYGDCENGYGHRKNSDGSRIEGKFTNGKINGYGLKHYKNGASYTGTWKNGIEDGSGFYFNPHERKWFKAQFSNGKLIDESALGFTETKPTENELKMDDLIETYKSLGIIEIGDSEDLELLENN
ncbi:MAG: C1 family peptidase [Flavobacteriales bacterium]|nr:C1 family peptidase [Flavobacteriales bacterium]